MTDEERKAWLDYEEKRRLWKIAKRICMNEAFTSLVNDWWNIPSSNHIATLDERYKSMRSENKELIRGKIIDAWNARCRAIKLRKEIRND